MIVDFHVHPRLDEPVETPRRLLALGAPLGIELMLLLGDVLRFGYQPDEGQIQQINDDTLAALDRWPQAFRGLCHVNPGHDPAFVRAEIERCLAHPLMRGVKLEVSVNARDARLDPIMAELQRRGRILLHHAWYKTTGRVAEESTPADIAALARRWPAVRIVMAHLTPAGPRGVQDVRPHANVWVDTSGAQPVAGMVEYGVRELGAERLVFGSDAPGRDLAVQLARVLGADLTEAQRQLILRENALRLLGEPC